MVGTTLDRLGEVALLDLLEASLQRNDGESGGRQDDGLGLAEIGRVVSLLRLVDLPGEEDKLLLVGLEAGDVEGEALLAQVSPARIDRDTDGRREKTGNASSLLEEPEFVSHCGPDVSRRILF